MINLDGGVGGPGTHFHPQIPQKYIYTSNILTENKLQTGRKCPAQPRRWERSQRIGWEGKRQGQVRICAFGRGLRGKKGIQGTHLPSAASRLSHVWGAPATEPNTGNMSLHGWLEAAGRKAQLWEAGTHVWGACAHWLAAEMGREGGLKTALGAAQFSVTAIILSSLSWANAPALLHITAPYWRKDCPDWEQSWATGHT